MKGQPKALNSQHPHAAPSDKERLQTLASEIERLKRLNSFCGHELKSLIGILQTSLLLYTEENPRPESEIDHLIFQGLDSLKDTLKKIDETVQENKSQIKMIWVVSENPDLGPRSDLPHDYFSVVLQSPEEVRENLKAYQPDALIIHESLFSNDWHQIIGKSSTRIPHIFCIGSNPPHSLLKLVHHSFQSEVELMTVVNWMWQQRGPRLSKLG